jgi:hypothetical protein
LIKEERTAMMMEKNQGEESRRRIKAKKET